jgi:hypothetical protein
VLPPVLSAEELRAQELQERQERLLQQRALLHAEIADPEAQD